MPTRREFLTRFGYTAAFLLSGCRQDVSSPKKAETAIYNGLIMLPQGESNLSLLRTDGSPIAIPTENSYPRPVGINPKTFEEIIKMSETDQAHRFPDFTLRLENKITGRDAENSRTWTIKDGRFIDVKTQVMMDLRLFSGTISTGLLLAKYQGRSTLGGKNIEKMLTYIPDKVINTHTVQDVAVAHLTAVLAEELVEANWSSKYLETHMVGDYQRDFPNPAILEEVTDTYSLPHKRRVFGLVLEKRLQPGFIFPQSSLITRETVADFFRTSGADENQIRELMKQWSSRLQAENIN